MPEPPPVDRLPPPKTLIARVTRVLRRIGPRAVRAIPRIVRTRK
jgi:hypothetical protein